jgi:1-phosphofructokinase family hexose kinase
MSGERRIGRLVGVSLNPAIDKIAAVEALRPGRIHRPEMLAAVPGGKALNAVRAARHLGLPADVVAVVGGHAGAWLAAELDGRGIRHWLVWEAGETRTCLSVLDRETGELTEFYEVGVVLPEDRWPAVEAALGEALQVDAEATVVLLAGSLPPGAPIDAYGRLARLGRAAGARVVIDIGGLALGAALDARPWLVKINAAEASETTGIATADQAGAFSAAHVLRDRGAELVVITMGMDGAILVTAEGDWVVGPPPERGPYSVGSGDALLGGLVAALARGVDLPEALRYGSAAATANALLPGQGELDPADIERLLPGCSLTRR